MSTRHRRRFASGPQAAAEARRWIESLQSDLGLDEERESSLRLLISELVTNSYRHAGLTAGDPIEVRVAPRGHRVRVEVLDHGRRFTPSVHEPTLEDGSGWGLTLVNRLATTWGVSSGRPKKVWFELDARSGARSTRLRDDRSDSAMSDAMG